MAPNVKIFHVLAVLSIENALGVVVIKTLEFISVASSLGTPDTSPIRVFVLKTQNMKQPVLGHRREKTKSTPSQAPKFR